MKREKHQHKKDRFDPESLKSTFPGAPEDDDEVHRDNPLVWVRELLGDIGNFLLSQKGPCSSLHEA